MVLSKCAVVNSKKPKFIKEKRATGVLSNFFAVQVPVSSDFLY